MQEQDENIIVSDPTIISFYKSNPNLNFIAMNHIFIDILKSLSTNLSSTITSTINSKILTLVTDIHSNLKTEIILKLHEFKKEYIEDVKSILLNNSLSTHEKITNIIERNNDSLLAKTTLIVNEVIPKSNDKNYVQIENCIKSFCSSISQDTAKLLEMTNKDDKNQSIIENIETKMNSMFSTIQQPMFSFIKSSEDRTNLGLDQIKEFLTTQNQSQQLLHSELNDFLNKYKNNSSSKGNISESELYFMLQSLMPSDEIIRVGTDTATCDFKVNRVDKTKPTILFENKDYTRSVNTDEVKKFERDLQTQKSHGIFLSQKSPITYKHNFQIDIINGLIHLYIPNAEYDTEKLRLAVDIIDNLSLRLQMIDNASEEDIPISKEDLDDVLDEYKTFVNQKMQMNELIKTMSKQLNDKMEEIQLPKLNKLFIKIGRLENDNEFKCSFCNIYSGKNKASLGAHMRNCKMNPKNKEQEVENIIISDEEKETEPKRSKRIKK
jgi:hypothetical protein